MTDLDSLLAAVRADPGNNTLRKVYADELAESGDELGAIMQRIIAEPGEDRWRLDYAAELERTAKEVECEKCNGAGKRKRGYCDAFMYGCDEFGDDDCSHKNEIITCGCNHGRVSDGRAELAEFIRVQMEVAKLRPIRDWGTTENTLRRRERELWSVVRGRFEGEGCAAYLGDLLNVPPSPFASLYVSRGLPAVVRCTLAEWMGGECERCDWYGLRDAVYNGEPNPDCPACRGTGRTPGIGPKLAQRWPIERVEVTDAEPAQSNAYLGKWRWYTDARNQREVIPKGVYQLLEGSAPDGENQPYWDSESAACTALSDALLTWAREQSIEEGRA